MLIPEVITTRSLTISLDADRFTISCGWVTHTIVRARLPMNILANALKKHLHLYLQASDLSKRSLLRSRRSRYASGEEECNESDDETHDERCDALEKWEVGSVMEWVYGRIDDVLSDEGSAAMGGVFMQRSDTEPSTLYNVHCWTR